jgi:plasmid stabilization system protein ParE
MGCRKGRPARRSQAATRDVKPIIWSPQAIHDIESIRAFIAQDSPSYAELVAQRLVAAVERLQSFPESGRIVPERQDAVIREIMETTEKQRAIEALKTLPDEATMEDAIERLCFVAKIEERLRQSEGGITGRSDSPPSSKARRLYRERARG